MDDSAYYLSVNCRLLELVINYIKCYIWGARRRTSAGLVICEIKQNNRNDCVELYVELFTVVIDVCNYQKFFAKVGVGVFEDILNNILYIVKHIDKN